MIGMRLPLPRAFWLAPLALFLLSFASPARAQFWNKKDYQHWSAGECHKILTDSPWAQSRSYSTPETPNGPLPNMAPRPPQTTIEYIAQFFSALPVRQAQVRIGQIQSHYDRMTPAQKKAFDENAARYLAALFPDRTIIRVIYSSNIASTGATLQRVWQREKTTELKDSVHLVVDGKRVRLARFLLGPPQEHEFFLFFPRQVDGRPLLDPSRKSVTLQVGNPHIWVPMGSGSSSNIRLEFKVREMIYNGKVAY